MRRILLVGGAGYIGSVLTGYLLDRGYEVLVLDWLLYNNILTDTRVHFIAGDLLTEAALIDITDVVILAGLVGDPICKKYPREHHLINVEGLKRFIAKLNGRGLDRVIFLSTCSNYGEIPDDALADEDYPLKPLSAYARAKVEREEQLLTQNRIDYCPTVLRLATAFGLSPRMRFDLTVSEFTRELSFHHELHVYDADTWRPYCHVQDICRAITMTLEAEREKVEFDIFNVGGWNFTKRMIVEEINKTMYVGNKAKFIANVSVDRRNYRVDFSKIRNRLGFAPTITIQDGIWELLCALKRGEFSDYDKRINFYRNHEINYPT